MDNANSPAVLAVLPLGSREERKRRSGSGMELILCNVCREKYTSRETWKNAPLIAWCCDRCLEAIRDCVWDSRLGDLGL